MTVKTAGRGSGSCPRCSGKYEKKGRTFICPDCGFQQFEEYSAL